MSDALDWSTHAEGWPNAEASRFVEVDGMRWHVQVAGRGPGLLMVHGTGASAHSWAGLLPPLSRHFTVVAPDLPGHAFTGPPPRRDYSLPGMARALDGLLAELGVAPVAAIGHSAGAAIIARMTLDGSMTPSLLISLNGALLPFGGAAGVLYSSIAKLLVQTSVLPSVFAWRASDRKVVARLLASTGSQVPEGMADCYAVLARSQAHVAGALRMMADWDLSTLAVDMRRIEPHFVLIAASNDRTVSPSVSMRVHRSVPQAKLVRLPALGHLAHEEDPDRLLSLILAEAQAAGVPRAS